MDSKKLEDELKADNVNLNIILSQLEEELKTRNPTLFERFEYLRQVFETESKVKVNIYKFISRVFVKLEEEIRSGTSGIEKGIDKYVL